MSGGTWIFKDVADRQLAMAEREKKAKEKDPAAASGRKRKALLHTPSGEVISSYSSLDAKLKALGWERYSSGDVTVLEYHKPGSLAVISLPRDFADFQSIHMVGIVNYNPDAFRIIDAETSS